MMVSSVLGLLCVLATVTSTSNGYSCACDNECAPSVIKNKLALFWKAVMSIRNDGSDPEDDEIELGRRLGVSLGEFQDFLREIADENIVYYSGSGFFDGFDEFTDDDTGYAAAIYPGRRGSVFVFDSVAVDITIDYQGNENAEVDYFIYRRTPGTDDTTVNLQHGKQTWKKYYVSNNKDSSDSNGSGSSRGHNGKDNDNVTCQWKLLLAGFEGTHLYNIALGSFEN